MSQEEVDDDAIVGDALVEAHLKDAIDTGRGKWGKGACACGEELPAEARLPIAPPARGHQRTADEDLWFPSIRQ